MARDPDEEPPLPEVSYACAKCGTSYPSIGEALACPCRSGGEP